MVGKELGSEQDDLVQFRVQKRVKEKVELGAELDDLAATSVGSKKQAATLVKNPTKEMRWISLHHHSTFSYLDGFALPATHARRAAELGMPALALTEHGNISSHVKLERAAKEEGIKPIFGCELYTAASGPDGLPEKQQRKNHLTVLAEDETGYQNLIELVSTSWNESFYYEPTISGAQLAKRKSGLIVMSGCLGSLLATSLVGGKNIRDEDASFERGLKVARRFKETFGDSYYLEVQLFPELEKTRAINEALEEIGRKLNIPLVATGDVHYTKPEESEMQMILHNVRGGGRQTLEEQARAWGYDVSLAPPISDKEVLRKLRGTGLSKRATAEALANAEIIAARCSVTLPKVAPLQYVPSRNKHLNTKELWELALKWGWKFRNIDDKPNRKEYLARLRKEKKIIEEKDFIDYFLIVADVVVWSKNSGIAVGPARGSAAASLICYLLRITEVDPVPFKQLIFERFIDKTREDFPDIDLDFDGARRNEVRDYVVSKYGSERVANIGTFTKYKSKNSLDDIARVHRIPKWEVDVIKDMMIERSSGDLRASETIEDTAERFEEVKKVFDKYPQLWQASQLEGNVRGMGVHAAGLIVGSQPIKEICAVVNRKIREDVVDVISIDKYDAEYLGMLKIDVLGLNTMSMIAQACDLAGLTLKDIYSIPYDDKKTIKGFQNNDVTGIFQFDGRATRDINAGVKPDNFEEICLINALSRPGPLHNGATTAYIDIKRGVRELRSVHPIFDEICGSTANELVYQEQILALLRRIGNFDWTNVMMLRRIISRVRGEQEFNRYWDIFRDGALKNGLDETLAREIWMDMITAGAYTFNAAHAYSYGLLAYWCMWLKQHHPQAFYVAALSNLNPNKTTKLLRDAAKKGIKVLPPHPVKSDVSWKPEGKNIRAGLSQISGIGDKMALRIIEHRNEARWAEAPKGRITWNDLQAVKGIGPVKIQQIKAFTEKDDPFDVYLMTDRLQKVRDWLKKSKELPKPTHTAADIPYVSGESANVVWVGIIKHRNLRNLWEINQKKGIELDPSTVKSPELDEWMIMTCEDEEETVTVTINRFKWPKLKEAIWRTREERDVIVVKGFKPAAMSARVVQVNDIWVIDPD